MSVLIFITLAFSGDLFQDYLRHFEYNFDYTDFTLPFSVNSEEMTQELLDIAQKHSVRFFTVKHEASGIYSEKATIYCSDFSVIEEIYSVCKITTKTYDSIFFGKTEVTAQTFKNSADELLTGNYYLLGEKEDETSFKLELMEKYGGGLVRDGYNTKDDDTIVIALCTATLIVFALLTLFEFFMKQKEYAVTMIMGVDPDKIFLKNFISDILVLCAVSTISYYIVSKITYPAFGIKYHVIAFLALIVTDTLPYFFLKKMATQKVLKGQKGQKSLLTACRIAKTAATILTVVLVATNLLTAVQAYSWTSQKDFWENYSSYYQLSARLVTPDGNYNALDKESLEASYEIYSKIYNKSNVTVITKVADTDFFGQEVIGYNGNNFEYLSENIKGVDFLKLKKNTVYALFPQEKFPHGLSYEDKMTLNHMANQFVDWSGSYNSGAEVIYYEGNIKLISVEGKNNFDSTYFKNPIVLFVNFDDEKFPRINTGDFNIGSNSYFTFYDCSPKDYKELFESFAQDGQQVQLFYSNIGELYQHKSGVAKKSLYISSVLTILFIILNLLITFITTGIDYRINSVELSIKKVTGYSLLARQKEMLIISFYGSIASTIAAVIICLLFKLIPAYYVAVSGAVFMAVDLFATVLIIRKTERARVLKILKGGAL